MTNFPSGRLLLREVDLIGEAHKIASELASEAMKLGLDLRLLEVSPTAAGAWICAWLPNEPATETATKTAPKSSTLAARFQLEDVEVNETLMNAFLSLAPKPDSKTETVLILEGASVADVFRSAKIYEEAGATLLELRVKRSGPVKGAYAFLSSADPEISARAPLVASAVKLAGDYRRFFF